MFPFTLSSGPRRLSLALAAIVLSSLFAPAEADSGAAAQSPDKPKVLHLPMRTDGPKSLDPVRGSTVYDNRGA